MDIVARLYALLNEKDWSVYKLATEAGLTKSTLYSIINDGISPTVKTIEAICEALDISVCEFFDVKYQPKSKIIELYDSLSLRDKKIVDELITILNKV